MSDIDLAVRRSKRLESRLRRDFGARGRGLHELIDAANRKNALPSPLVRRLRFIATVRNRIVHDLEYTAIDDREGFIAACDSAERELEALAGPRDTWRTTVIVVAAMAFMLLAALAITIWLLRSRQVPLW